MTAWGGKPTVCFRAAFCENGLLIWHDESEADG